MADTDREENRIQDTEGEEIIIEGPEDEKQPEDASPKTEEGASEPGNAETSDGQNPEEPSSEETAEEITEETEEKSGQETAEEPAEETVSSGKAKDAEVRGRLEEGKLKKQIEDLTDKLKRSLAEFDNFRKRTDKEKSSMYDIGARDIVEKMLPVLDNFERGLAAAPADDKFAEGMQMIYKQLVTALTDAGVKPIEAVGQTFDPELHNAVMHVEDENLGENVVAEEFQKGYLFKDHVVRHSMVKVAN